MSKVMLITGGSRGIGAATALLAAGAGYDVGVNYTSNQTAADGVVAACQAMGVQAVAIQADVSDEVAVIAMFDQIADQLGSPNAVINNAGFLPQVDRFENYTASRMRKTLEINVFGSMLVAREAVRRMSTANGGAGGSIVNVSSAASYLGSPTEFIDYAASKGAIDSLTIGLAKEVATEGLRVNGVRPGLIETEIHASAGAPDRVERLKYGVPMGRGGSAEEVAETIMWLASDNASYVTGALLNVAGGR
jgi:NAD(P)-dependent dehydrogenase (short-subunit alcohol dehydrogenase family)